LKVYQSRKETAIDSSSLRHLPQLHAN
jgi:hypothetical protein